MTDLKEHVSARGSATSLLTSRFSKHPERYVEIFRVLRKYKLHHVVAELGLSHRHDDEDGEELHELPSPNGHVGDHDDHDHEDAHGIQLASALEELGPC